MSYLRSIVQSRREDIFAEKHACDSSAMRHTASARSDQRDFVAAIRRGKPAIIAEIKRASPSLGSIVDDLDPALIAAQYEEGGAAAISVLTEERNFQGSFADLARARSAVSLPVLCKDFIVDEFQIWKAAASGADAVLLITAALTERQLRSFVRLCAVLKLVALVEIHNTEEVQLALNAGAHLFGINNRDLHSFQVDVKTALHIRPYIPAGCTVVAESGYKNAADVRAAAAAGFDAVLVGEILMRAPDRSQATRLLLGEPAWSG